VFVAQGIKHAKRMRRIVILVCLAVHFSHYLTKRMIFSEKVLNIKCVYSLYLHLLSETFVIIERHETNVIKKCELVFM
jgi:hypothetical protein